MLRLLDKVRQRYTEQGAAKATRSLALDAARRLVDPHREFILMEVDLAQPKAQPSAAERARCTFTIRDLVDDDYPGIIDMLRTSEPWRIDAMAERKARRTPGIVAYEDGKVVAYMFYETSAPDRPVHPDFDWLDMKLGPDELYTFDAFIPVALRGRGIMLYKLSYELFLARGYKKVRGYCYVSEKPAIWSYRVLGWRELERRFEHRIAGRWVVVNQTLYRLNRFDRTRLVKLPIPHAVAEAVRSTRAPRAR